MTEFRRIPHVPWCMPFMFNGVGTTLYGARDFRPDGSYVTTEWLVFAYLPALPLKSMRIRPAGDGKNYGVYASSRYFVLERLGLNGRQVLSVYAWFATIAASITLTVQLEQGWFMIPAIMALGAPWFLRRRAAKRMAEEYKSRQSIGIAA
jgi:hypothetical protein